MSCRDTFHHIVKQALSNEGWRITHDPYSFEVDPELSTDLGGERMIGAEQDAVKIAVEIKSFISGSQVVELEKALGQYELYNRLLRRQEPDRTLYLAIPIHAYADIFQRQVGQIILEEFQPKLMIYGISPEEGLQWKTPPHFIERVSKNF